MANATENHSRLRGRGEDGVPAGLLTRVSWGSILAGAVVAVATMVLFSLLGFGIGFGVANPLYEENALSSVATVGGIYFIVTQLVSTFVGGWVAAKLSGVTITNVAALHGFSVWAVTTIFVVLLGFTGASAIAGGLTSLAGSTLSSAENAVEEVLPGDLPQVRVPEITMRDLPQPIRQTLEDEGVTPDQLTSAVRETFRDVVSQQEIDRLRSELRTTAQEIIRTPGDIEQDLMDMRETVVGGPDAVFSEQDLNQARDALQSRLPIETQQAEQIVGLVQARIERALDEVSQAVQTARQQAIEAAQATTEAVSNASLAAFFASALGLVAAVAGGVAGRPKSAAVTNV
jgi:hypothetical protein